MNIGFRLNLSELSRGEQTGRTWPNLSVRIQSYYLYRNISWMCVILHQQQHHHHKMTIPLPTCVCKQTSRGTWWRHSASLTAFFLRATGWRFLICNRSSTGWTSLGGGLSLLGCVWVIMIDIDPCALLDNLTDVGFRLVDIVYSFIYFVHE